ncbi:integrin-linked protein kinase-like isoform X2 [Oscarella lobularis]|uniref:integrin-linked protein kinase-like isoform X2 n=1 Tax=Oscarella lobularis TaxID=121494 RepID=UPI0033133008
MDDIFYCVRQGSVDAVRKWLYSTENDPNCTDEHGFTPLHWASRQGRETIAEMLIARGARVDIVNMGGDSALHLASAHGYLNIAKILIRNRASVRGLNEHGNSPLHYACFWNYGEVAEELMDRGAPVAQANKDGQTPLNKAKRMLARRLVDKASRMGQEIETIPYRASSSTHKSKADSDFKSRDADISMSSLTLSIKLSDTSTGELWKGIWTGHTVVAKKLKITGNLSKQTVDTFRDEFMKCRIFSHPNILPVLGAVVEPPILAVVSQYISHGSLFNVLHTESAGISFTENHRLEWAYDIAKAITYLHSLELSKPSFLLRSHHIMIEDDFLARINLGDAKWCVVQTHKTHYPQWLPPEILRQGYKQKNLNMKMTNVWNYAVILFELATGKLPFEGLHPAQVGMRVAREGIGLEIPRTVSKQISRLMSLCFSFDPLQRPPFSKICPIVEQMVRERVPLSMPSAQGVAQASAV